MSTLIKAENVTRKYVVGGESIYALNNVSAEVESAGLSIFCGRSGSGKTTLLNQLSLLDRPDEGVVELDGTNASDASDSWRDEYRRTHFGIIFQSVALMPYMNALENIEFGLRVANMPYAKRKGRAKECLSIVGLAKRWAHMPTELSGGEQQRVAIARAIAHSPSVLFADEPTAELDSQTGLQIVKLFFDLIEEHGVTVVMTTHDPRFMELGRRVYTLQDGEIVDG